MIAAGAECERRKKRIRRYAGRAAFDAAVQFGHVCRVMPKRGGCVLKKPTEIGHGRSPTTYCNAAATYRPNYSVFRKATRLVLSFGLRPIPKRCPGTALRLPCGVRRARSSQSSNVGLPPPCPNGPRYQRPFSEGIL